MNSFQSKLLVMLNALVMFGSRPRVVTASTRLSAFVSTAGRRQTPYLTRPSSLGTSGNPPFFLSTEGSRRTVRFVSSDSKESKGEERKKGRPKSKKIKVKEITPEKIDKLTAAFAELAAKEGFDSSQSRFADDETFEDYFEEDDFLDDDDDIIDEMEEQQMDFDDMLDSSNFDLSDFEISDENDIPQERREVGMEIDSDDDYLDFGGGDDDDMEARIAAAKRDMTSGSVTVPEELDRFGREASDVDLRKLGFKRELNPFGDDETPRKEQFKLITDAMTCSACGSDFQSTDDQKPGYLPPAKFEIQTKLAKIEEMQQLKAKADAHEWSPEDEIEYLIQTSGGKTNDNDPFAAADIDIDAMAEEMGLDLVELSQKKIICKRCHGLQNFGKVEESLRPGWTEEPTISQEKFRNLLKPISEQPAVIIALVDLFDFGGSVLRELDGIAGDNPVILAANKVDLLPSNMGKQRAENWVRRELEYMGVKSLANIGGAVRLISCKTGAGVRDMIEKARKIADDMDCDVYVVGAANAGKSTLINHILAHDSNKRIGKIRAGNRNAFKGALTTSPLPGTTLKFIKVDLGDGKSLYDTPGLLVPGTVTQLLTPEELKIVCPKK